MKGEPWRSRKNTLVLIEFRRPGTAAKQEQNSWEGARSMKRLLKSGTEPMTICCPQCLLSYTREFAL